MSIARSTALVALAFATLAVLATEAAAQVTGLTVTPNPAVAGSPVTITVEAVGCTEVAVSFGDGTPTALISTGSWPQKITHSYVNPGIKNLSAQGLNQPPSICFNTLPVLNLVVTPAFQLLTELLVEIRWTAPLQGGINKVDGVVSPGNNVGVRGSGFGAATGTVTLVMPGYTGKLDCCTWADQFVNCIVPRITGVPDTPASVYVTSAAGSDSNRWPVSFVAERDIIPAPASAVSVSCSNTAGLDMCSAAPPLSFSGFHQDLDPTCNWASEKFGSDQYDLNLKNGWRAHRMITTDVRTNSSQAHVPSGAQTSFKIGWRTYHLCWIGYLVRFSIIGPKGLPVQ